MSQWICPDCGFSYARAGRHRGSAPCLKNQQRAQAAAADRSLQPDNATTSNPTLPVTQPLPQLPRSARRRILRRIPKAARPTLALTYTKLLRKVATEKSTSAWQKLFSATPAILSLPSNKRASRRISLTALIKNKVALFERGEDSDDAPPAPPRRKKEDNDETLRARVDEQLNDFSITGAVRTIFSTDTLADSSPEVIQSLQDKHPQAPPPQMPDSPECAFVPLCPDELVAVLRTMPKGSAGGMDGLRPQHLLDLIGQRQDDASKDFCEALTDVLNLILAAEVPADIVPYLCGARLVALRKKDGGIRPIAIGNILRRLAAKIVDIRSRPSTVPVLQPYQLGSGTKGGAEAIVHGTRAFLQAFANDVKCLLKVDLRNAFNSVSRDQVLKQAAEHMPEYFPFVNMCYGSHSNLYFKDTEISSQSGVQQGDPLGPTLFCLAIQPIIERMDTALNAWYMDDGTLGDDPRSVLRNFTFLVKEMEQIGLSVNTEKCELFLCGGTERKRASARAMFESEYPGIREITAENLELLGSPLLPSGVLLVINQKITQLAFVTSRLKLLPKHQALFLLKNCLGVPKILYLLRTSLAWMFPAELYRLDQAFRTALESIINVKMDLPSWLQATLPVRLGGLGIRRTEELAPSAFLASGSSLRQMISGICPTAATIDFTAVQLVWEKAAETPDIPPRQSQHIQRAWDTPICLATHKKLFELHSARDEIARLKAVSCPESGVWLNALPAACLGNLLDDNAFKISIALRLGAPMVTSHTCVCGTKTDSLGRHGLSCKRSAGRIIRHDTISAEFARALKTSGHPSRLEPKGLSTKVRKKPDVITYTAWERGKPLSIDVTCVDTLCASYVDRSFQRAGAAADLAEQRKYVKYAFLENRYVFTPAVFEIYGTWGDGTKRIVEKVGRDLSAITGEPRSKEFLRQKLSMLLQKGNALCVMGTIPDSVGLDEIFLLA